MAKLDTQTFKLSDLTEAPVNPMIHLERNLDAIRRSLLRFEQVSPLVIRAANSEVIAGNARLRVMRELGWEECECVVLDIDEREAKALAVAMNKTGQLAEWDMQVTTDILRDLQAVDFDLLDTGFDVGEIAGRLAPVPDFTPVPEDEQPRLDEKKPVTCPECGHEFTT